MRKNEIVLLLGSGGRECAIAWAFAQSPWLQKLYVAPGNGGTGAFGENVSIKVTNFEELIAFAKEKGITLVVCQLDDQLDAGYVDRFRAEGFRAFGATAAAAQIEASKAFSKKLMGEAGIPTPNARVFDLSSYQAALRYVEIHGAPLVVKVSGLALGKGAYSCFTVKEAQDAIYNIMYLKAHGPSNTTVLIEDFLEGHEISAHALTDGVMYHLFPLAQDHKKSGECDTGKNTGGMGVIVPIPCGGPHHVSEVEQIVQSALSAMQKRGTLFEGCLYPGLMDTLGRLQVLEFNARFGDPEAQAYVRLLKSDLLELIVACVDGALASVKPEWRQGSAVSISLVSGGYPDDYKRFVPITGIKEAEKVPGVVVFHAGTDRIQDVLLSSGGRVLSVTCLADTPEDALARAYEAASKIYFEGVYYRRDIGKRALAHVSRVQ